MASSTTSSVERHRLIDLLQASLQAKNIAAALELADTMLGYPDPDRPRVRYRQIAESAIGQLDPARQAVAEHRAVQTMLRLLLENGQSPFMTPEQRLDVVRRAFRQSRIVYEMVLAGSLAASWTLPHVDEKGAVIS